MPVEPLTIQGIELREGKEEVSTYGDVIDLINANNRKASKARYLGFDTPIFITVEIRGERVAVAVERVGSGFTEMNDSRKQVPVLILDGGRILEHQIPKPEQEKESE